MAGVPIQSWTISGDASDLDRGHAGRFCGTATPITKITCVRYDRPCACTSKSAELRPGCTYRGIGKGTVGKWLLLARAAGVDWAGAQTLSDKQLEERLYRPAVPRDVTEGSGTVDHLDKQKTGDWSPTAARRRGNSRIVRSRELGPASSQCPDAHQQPDSIQMVAALEVAPQ